MEWENESERFRVLDFITRHSARYVTAAESRDRDQPKRNVFHDTATRRKRTDFKKKRNERREKGREGKGRKGKEEKR